MYDKSSIQITIKKTVTMLLFKDEQKVKGPFRIHTGDDGTGILTKALLVGNVELAVEICIEQDRMADALILAMRGGPDLLDRTQRRYFSKRASAGAGSDDDCNLIESFITGEWHDFISRVSPANSREALVAVVTHASDDEFQEICTALGDRLEMGSQVRRNLKGS